MKRFDYEESNDDDDLFPDGHDDEDVLNAEYIKVLEKRELVEAIKLQLMQRELNSFTLTETIKYLEKSWFWKFKSKQKKLDLIVETYQMFKALADIDSQGEPEIEEM
jgi:hypothetical protein